MKLIVGLGNPGDKYKNTRHNAGFLVVDSIFGSDFKDDSKFRSLVLKTAIEGKDAFIAKPLTYMNRCGEAVALIANYYKIQPEDTLIIHDDWAFEIGDFRLQFNKSANRHNGVQSIIDSLGTQKFWRFRVGIGGGAMAERLGNRDSSDFVLTKFGSEDLRVIDERIPRIKEDVYGWVEN